MTPEEIKQELGYFAPGVLRLNPGALPLHITRAEKSLGLTFPASFRQVLGVFNGGFLLGEQLLGVPPVATALDLVRETHQAHAYWGQLGWSKHFVGVGADGVGNPFVLLLDRRDERDESPVGLFDAGSMQITEIVASDYLHFVWFLIQDVRWNHDPEGKPLEREAVVWTRQSVTVRPGALPPWRFNEAWMIANDPGLARWR
ncbi:MAG: SMI1/KNR4 family protein [Armatimonadetes bacterium]|nr:SMI1/KNR4 family protein [Armatimonadota bacterium]